jgi:hypothetical protein
MAIALVPLNEFAPYFLRRVKVAFRYGSKETSKSENSNAFLNDEIAKLSTNGLAARKQIVKRFGRDRLKRLAPLIQHDENHDFSAMMSSTWAQTSVAKSP